MPDDTITLVSTTDSLEEVQAALTGKPATPPAEAQTPAPSEPPTPAPVAPVTEPPAEPAEPAEPVEPSEEAAPKKKPTRQEKIQREIDELTWRKNSVRRDVEAEEARLHALRQQLQQTPPKPAEPPPPAAKPAEDAPPEPKVDAVSEKGEPLFKTYEDYLSAHAKWTADEAVRAAKKVLQEAQSADRARIEQESASRVVNDRLAQYNTNLEAFKKTHADFDAAFAEAKDSVQDALVALGPQALKVIDGFTVFDAEDGPALTYYLLKHPDELKGIALKAPQQQLIALARLEERIRDTAAPKKKTGPVAVPAPETKAPTPITPVSAGPTATTAPSLEEAEYQDYKRVRERQIRERRGA